MLQGVTADAVEALEFQSVEKALARSGAIGRKFFAVVDWIRAALKPRHPCASSGFVGCGVKPFFDTADDLRDAALSEFVFFGQVVLEHTGRLVVAIDLLIALARRLALTRLSAGGGDLA